MKKALIYIPLILLFVAGAIFLIDQNNKIAEQKAVIETASSVISAHRETIDGQQLTIDNMLVLNEALVSDVATFRNGLWS